MLLKLIMKEERHKLHYKIKSTYRNTMNYMPKILNSLDEMDKS